MSEPLAITLASTAVSLVNGTIGLLKEAKESAKRSDDHDLKDKLSEVFDSVLDLKEVIGNLRDENAELRARLEARVKLTWNTAQKLYFVEGDQDPFCPSCMDLSGRQIRLHPVFSARVIWKYQCKVCKNEFFINQ